MNSFRLLAGAYLMCLILAACGGGAKWTIAVQNDNAQAATVLVTLGADGKSNAKVEVKPGEKIEFITGSGDTVINTVNVTRGTDVKNMPLNTPLKAGRQCTIVISTDGTVTAATPK